MIHSTNKLLVLVTSVPVMIRTSGSGSFFLGNWTLEAVEASPVAEAAEVNEAGEVSKAWEIPTVEFWFLNSIILGLI